MNALNTKKMTDIMSSQTGAIGYLFAWLMGVPATILILIFLLRG